MVMLYVLFCSLVRASGRQLYQGYQVYDTWYVIRFFLPEIQALICMLTSSHRPDSRETILLSIVILILWLHIVRIRELNRARGRLGEAQ